MIKMTKGTTKSEESIHKINLKGTIITKSSKSSKNGSNVNWVRRSLSKVTKTSCYIFNAQVRSSSNQQNR